MEQILKRKSMKQPIRTFEKRILNLVYKPFVEWYTSRESSYKYKNYNIKVIPGVFHPRFFSSTGFMLEFLEFMNFSKKKVLEIGSGSGLISIVAAGDGAHVLAIDINPVAIKNTKMNVDLNMDRISMSSGSVEVVHSDLFEQVSAGIFDTLIVNPPFYRGEAKNSEQYAWFAGNNLEYFEKLFAQCKGHMNSGSEMYMVLSEDCDFNRIFEIATSNALVVKAVAVKQFLTENLYIFKITIAHK